MPGKYRFAITPYWREVIDTMSPESPVRHTSVMKAAQLGCTTLLENTIGFCISEIKTAPCMLLSADVEMARLRVEAYIIPMLELSGLDHLIQSLDNKAPQKTGRTARKLEWQGGGFLIPFGAVNANKLRSSSICYLFRDEVDGYPLNADGDPIQLSQDRTAAFESARKIFDVSTPLIKGTSRIEKLFQAGDRRYYKCRCLSCGFPQALRFSRTNKETGKDSGMAWETENDRLVEGSVRYLCENCGHAHANEDKTRLFEDGNAYWEPTVQPREQHHRSYALNSLYSPCGMQSWHSCVANWLNCWDVKKNRSRDNAALMVFYNTTLGKPFEERGERLKFEVVSSLRRHSYSFGEIPNKYAIEHCGSPILALTCAVDVHAKGLHVGVFGWTRGRRCFLIEYLHFEGQTENLDDPSWTALTTLITSQEGYLADNGTRLFIALTLIDSSFNTDVVHRYCSGFDFGVFGIRGRQSPPANSPTKEWWPYTSESGNRGWSAHVDGFKDRWHAALKRPWDGQSQQPDGHFNCPIDTPDSALKELTIETRREKIDKSGKRLGFSWYRPNHAPNELWDVLVYATVALELLAYDVCIKRMQMDSIDFEHLWRSLE
jgi:phage terminase large subunit GpA-like protein